MKQLSDGVHECKVCELFPCTMQEFVKKSNVCKDCVVGCCNAPMVALLPCEINSKKIEADEEAEGMIRHLREYGSHSYCYAFDVKTKKCRIYKIRPIACRIATCRWIEQKKTIK